MRYRDLGTTGLRVSLLGLGSVKFGRTQALKYPTRATLPSLEELDALLGIAHELGVNLIDTAPAYGVAEARLGELLAGRRHRWLLSTKVGESFERGVSRYDFSPAATRRSVEESLQRLRTDYLDVVLVHSDGRDLDIIDNCGTLDALAQLEREGMLRAFGISTKTVAGGVRAAALCDVVMVALSPARPAALEVVAAARGHGCGVLIKQALDSGHAAVDAQRCTQSLRWIAATPGVSSIVVGTTDPAHLRDNAAALEPCEL